MSLKRFMSSKSPRSTAATGFVLMLFFWLTAVELDAYYAGSTFLGQLLHPERGALGLRLLCLAIQFLFILYIARLLGKYRRQGELLQKALQLAEVEELRSQEILEAVGDAISIQDLDMKILYQNQMHKQMMGEHVGEYCYAAYQQKDAVCPSCHLSMSFLDGKPHSRETSAQTRDGLKLTEIISTPLRDASGKIVAGIEAVRDVTERKRANMEIQRMNGELELRAQELADANRELESFSYSLSHDLRSYITRISTAQQMLVLGNESTPEAEFLVQSIDDSCRGMDELIEAMLTLSRLSRREMQWEEVALSEMVQEVALCLQQQELGREVDFTVSPSLKVNADPHLLHVALENLLGNAWKYTRHEPVARIEFGVGERDGRPCYFVKDNGVGFDMAEHEKLFRPFQRLQSARGFAGTGVGLATVQRAIARHGGDVWGEGEPGKGATLYFTLADRAGA
jgi:signal transduction histidine kinase